MKFNKNENFLNVEKKEEETKEASKKITQKTLNDEKTFENFKFFYESKIKKMLEQELIQDAQIRFEKDIKDIDNQKINLIIQAKDIKKIDIGTSTPDETGKVFEPQDITQKVKKIFINKGKK